MQTEKKTLMGETIINEEGRVAMRNYKYAGDDPSYIYKYVTGPISQKIVDHVYPTWLA